MPPILSLFRNVSVVHPKTGEIVKLTVELNLNLDRIAAELGRKALRNKQMKSTLAIGIAATAKIQH